MTNMKEGTIIRTLEEITVIVGLRKTIIPKETMGAVARLVASDAGFVNLLCHGMVFLMASEMEEAT